MSKKKTDAPPDWITESHQRQRGWDGWTDEMKAAVTDGLKWRGEGYAVSATTVSNRIQALGGKASTDIVNRYCRDILGRRSFANE